MVPTLEELMTRLADNPLLVVLWAGATASVSRCAALQLPIILAYVAGMSTSKKHGLLLSLLFALGLSAGIVLLGTTAAVADDGVHRVLLPDRVLFWGLGLALLVIGVLISGLIGPQILPRRLQNITVYLRKTSSLGALLLGGAFGLLQTPGCPSCGPALLALLETAPVESHGLVPLMSFAAGQSLMALSVGALTSLIGRDLMILLRAQMCSLEQRAQLLAGNILIVFGIYFVIIG